MNKEIRMDVREYILSQVNETLARLGVSENVVQTQEYEAKYQGTLHYKFESAPIRQMPMVFKELKVSGYMASVDVGEDSRFYKSQKYNDIVVVDIDYQYKHFEGGSNGCHVGRMIFFVSKDLPKSLDKSKYIEPWAYIEKIEGITL